MAESKRKTHKVGDVVKAKHVVRPDGSETDVTGGKYVLGAPGLYVIDGNEVKVR